MQLLINLDIFIQIPRGAALLQKLQQFKQLLPADRRHILLASLDTICLQQDPHIKDLINVPKGKLFDINPLVGHLNDQSIGHQLPQDLPHRAAAYPQLFRQFLLLKPEAGFILSTANIIPQDLIHLPPNGFDLGLCHPAAPFLFLRYNDTIFLPIPQ